MISMCPDWRGFRLAPEPASHIQEFPIHGYVEPSVLHPFPNSREPMISMRRDWPGFRLAPEPATFRSFLYTNMWRPPSSIHSQLAVTITNGPSGDHNDRCRWHHKAGRPTICLCWCRNPNPPPPGRAGAEIKKDNFLIMWR